MSRKFEFTDLGWPWQDLTLKQLLLETGTAKSANPSVLNITKFLHWGVLCLQFLILWVLFINHDEFITRLGGQYQVFLLILWPIFAALSAVPVLLMHSRERWQIAPLSDNPRLGNDFRLKMQSMRLFFSFITLSNMALFCGVYGISMYFIPFLFVVLFVVFVGPTEPLLGVKVGMHKEVPIAIPLAIAFIFSNLLRVYSFCALINFNLQSLPISIAISLCILFFDTMGGGFLEGVLAEKTFNQHWHLLAVISLFFGELISFVSLVIWA